MLPGEETVDSSNSTHWKLQLGKCSLVGTLFILSAAMVGFLLVTWSKLLIMVTSLKAVRLFSSYNAYKLHKSNKEN